MPIDLYPNIAKVKRNGVYQNLPGFVQQSGDADIKAMIANSESSTTAQYAHPKNSFFILNDVLYQADENIPINGTIAVGTNCHVEILSNIVSENENDVSDLKIDVNDLIDGVAQEVYDEIPFTETQKKLIAGDGNLADINDVNYLVSDYISVTGGTDYYITASANYNNCLYAWYNSEKSLVSKRGTGGSGSTVIVATNEKATAPSNASYLRIGYIRPTVGTVKVYGGLENNLTDRVESLEEVTPVPSKVRLIKSGSSLTLVDVDTGMYLTASTDGSNNGAFNLLNYYKSNGSVYKTAGDDICPVYYDGSYRGGNHGNYVGIAVTSASHGLTENDIGKVVISADDVEYVIIRIVDENTFWMVNNSQSRTFIKTIPTSPLLVNDLSIPFTSASLIQIRPDINKKYQSIYCDNTEIVNDGTYEGSCIIVVDGYYCIDTLEMLTALKENVGNNTNSSYYSDSLPADLLYETQYSFTGGLKTVVTGTIVIIRNNVNLTSWGVTQSQAMGTSVQSFVADTIDSDISLISGSVTYPPSNWLDSNFPPYKFYQFNNSDTTLGFAIVYDISYEEGIPEVRKLNVYNAYTESSPYKMYPFMIGKNTNNFLSTGTVIKATAIRYLISKNKPLVVTYKIGNETHVEIETFSDGVNVVNIGELPPNYKLKVLHTSSGVVVLDNITTGRDIHILGKGSISIIFES